MPRLHHNRAASAAQASHLVPHQCLYVDRRLRPGRQQLRPRLQMCSQQCCRARGRQAAVSRSNTTGPGASACTLKTCAARRCHKGAATATLAARRGLADVRPATGWTSAAHGTHPLTLLGSVVRRLAGQRGGDVCRHQLARLGMPHHQRAPLLPRGVWQRAGEVEAQASGGGLRQEGGAGAAVGELRQAEGCRGLQVRPGCWLANTHRTAESAGSCKGTWSRRAGGVATLIAPHLRPVLVPDEGASLGLLAAPLPLQGCGINSRSAGALDAAQHHAAGHGPRRLAGATHHPGWQRREQGHGGGRMCACLPRAAA